MSVGLAQSVQARLVFDVHALAMHEPFDGSVLARAMRATFERRRTEIPSETPIALTKEFADVEGKRAQWAAFVRRGRLTAPADLDAIISSVGAFVGPVLVAAARGEFFTAKWPAGGPWN